MMCALFTTRSATRLLKGLQYESLYRTMCFYKDGKSSLIDDVTVFLYGSGLRVSVSN